MGDHTIAAPCTKAVIHGISFAPTHQVLAREAAVAAQQNVDVGPAFADHPDDAADRFARTLGAIDVGGSELGEQEMAAAEDIEGQGAARLAAVLAGESPVGAILSLAP